MAPSLLQTLLRQPSQSYSSRTSPSPSLYDVSLHSSSQSRRTSSLRSSQSRDSSRSGGGGDWSNGQWEWAQYGGRAGLTKGPSSIHPSEVASALGVPGETRRSSSRQSSSRRGASRSESGTADEDTRSLRSQQSSKSLSSVRSSGSRSQPTWSSPAEATLRTNPRPSSQSSASRRYSSTDAAPSRRYSSLSPAPSNSSSSASTRRTSSASPSPSSEAPSLVSSLSSAPSSPPITPIHATPLALPLPPLDPPKSKRTKKQRAPREVVDIAAQQQHEDRGLEMVQEATEEEERRRSWVEPHEQVTALSEEAIEHGARTAERVEDEALVSSQTMGVLDKFAAPEPTLLDPSPRKSRQYYSVDEFFTLATGNPEPALTFPSPPSPTSSLAAPASETETEKTTVLNDSIERSTSPADQLVSATSSQEVPRIRLTRTESDQSAAGVKGDVEVPSDEEEEEADVPAPISTNITRKRTKRRPTTSDSPASTQPPTTIEVVASSSSSPSRSRSASPLPTTTPILHTPSSSADPAWLTRIRALGEPIEPLIQMPPPRSSKSSRSATPEPHWTVRQYEQRQKELKEQREREQPVRRPSSLGNLRRPRNVMEPMPEMDEGEVEVEVEVEQREEKVAEEKPVILAPPQMRRSASLNTGSPSTAPGDKARRSDSRTSMREGSSAGRPLSPAPEVAIAEERAPRRRTQSAIEPSPSSYYPPPTIAPHSGPISPSSRSSSISPAPTSHSQPLTCDALSAVSGPASQDLYDDEEEEDAPSLYSQTSTSRYSTMSVPTGAFSRPPKNPARNRNINRASMPSMPLDAAAMVLHHSPSPAPTKSNPNLMFTLSISASALARPSQGSSSNSSSFNPFKRTGGPSIEPPLSSSQTHSRRFSPVRDLTHSALSPLPSPKKLKSDEVLVEVIAVGLEGVDLVKTREMAGVREGFGWVPGRAVLGRVREVGETVEGKGTVKKGVMVWGVMGLKKSSALSELVTIPRDRLSLAPSPTDRLSIEEIASLPSAGACAMQVMEPICRDLPRGSKILILSAHRSIGYLCLQLASHLRPQRDLYLVAHCPSTMEADAQLCRDAGASSVLVEEPLAVLNGCHESEFDVVIDCVGGRRIYDASRRVLHHSGAFISTVSPLVVPSSSTTAPESSWKSSLRSLRRTFVKKDRKLLSVLSITSETIETRGESPREVLERVREAVEKGELRARIDKVWRFEDSARAFAEGEGESVVRVLEV